MSNRRKSGRYKSNGETELKEEVTVSDSAGSISESEDGMMKDEYSDSSEERKQSMDEDEEFKETKLSVKQEIHYQLFNELPAVTEEAQQTFINLEECTYSVKSLGNSGQDELMSCDCREQWDDEHQCNMSCGEDSDCINRLTSIECTNENSLNCGGNCRNQRFRRKEYAKVDVIQTEKKGYGLRAKENIYPGTFIYEYIGEVIDESRFRKRMREYEQQGIRHFYFMMLQKGEFIDATKKGCFARFCNHSCRPNSYVDKWVVGGKLRMGIFSKREILKGEEITFDYNVDRYGSQAQPCYCGESNCIGYLGGKTQTEAANKLPQLLIDALGLDEKDENSWITTTAKRKKKNATIDEEEYVQHLPVKPITDESVSKVMGSLLQCREEWLITKLMSRIYITTDASVHSRVMRMHGYQIFSVLLRDWSSNEQILLMIFEILTRWPKMTKNKISSSKIESVVQDIASESQFESAKDLATGLLSQWSNLQMAYRIPRRERKEVKEQEEEENVEPELEDEVEVIEPPKLILPSRPMKNNNSNKWKSEKKKNSQRNVNNTNNNQNHINGKSTTPSKSSAASSSMLPPGWGCAQAPDGKTYYFNRELNMTTWERPNSNNSAEATRDVTPSSDKTIELQKAQQKLSFQKIIEEANKQQALRAAELAQQMAKKQKPESHLTDSEKLERTLTKTFAKYVPNVVARYQDELGKDNVKKCSKEIVKVLVSKEMKPGHVVKSPSELSSEKKAKIKLFVKSYMEKVLTKFWAKRAAKSGTNSSNGHDIEVEVEHEEDSIQYTVESPINSAQKRSIEREEEEKEQEDYRQSQRIRIDDIDQGGEIDFDDDF